MRGSWNGTRQEVSTGAGSEPVATDRSSPGEWQDDSAGMQAEILEQTYFRWRKEYGGLQVDQAKRRKELEQENAKLKRLVAELSLDKLVLKANSRVRSDGREGRPALFYLATTTMRAGDLFCVMLAMVRIFEKVFLPVLKTNS